MMASDVFEEMLRQRSEAGIFPGAAAFVPPMRPSAIFSGGLACLYPGPCLAGLLERVPLQDKEFMTERWLPSLLFSLGFSNAYDVDGELFFHISAAKFCALELCGRRQFLAEGSGLIYEAFLCGCMPCEGTDVVGMPMESLLSSITGVCIVQHMPPPSRAKLAGLLKTNGFFSVNLQGSDALVAANRGQLLRAMRGILQKQIARASAWPPDVRLRETMPAGEAAAFFDYPRDAFARLAERGISCGVSGSGRKISVRMEEFQEWRGANAELAASVEEAMADSAAFMPLFKEDMGNRAFLRGEEA